MMRVNDPRITQLQGLNPGESKTIDFFFANFPDAGKYNTLATVDFKNEISETLEDNNNFEKEIIIRPEKILYKVSIRTGDYSDAGTDANVYITLFGTNDQTVETKFDDEWKGHFERAQTDDFEITSNDLGDLTKIYIRHDNLGNKAGWYFDHVIVTNTYDNFMWIFEGNRWLDADKGDKKIGIEVSRS